MDQQFTVKCGKHGKQKGAMACHHILTMTGQGFYVADPSDEELYPDAWCAECEYILAKERGWTEKALSFAKFGLICGHCYPLAKARNQILIKH